jgi:hypothetical protein
MRREPSRFVKRMMLSMTLLMIFAVFAVKLAMPASGILQPKGVNPSYRMNRGGDPYKILEVLEKKMGGKKISEKVRDKLFTLNEAQTRLVVSLCDRIVDDGRTTGGDIAYFLITAMIVLS